MWDPGIIDALRILRRDIPDLAAKLSLEDARISAWARILDLKLFPRTDPDFPLIAAICGGGSSGKSTLFNSLAASRISPTGGRAGINRRVLAGLNPKTASRKDFLLSLYEPFGAAPEVLRHPEDLEKPGIPLYAVSGELSDSIILLDTPDFDTGAQGAYENREQARKALETADIFIYIFTNSNYHNRDNTDFISHMLTDIGMRKAFLVYRVYPSFTDADVFDHAMTVARNVYGDAAQHHVLGIYRADESNAVADEKAFMTLRPAHGKYPSFYEAVASLDRSPLRQAMVDSIRKDAFLRAESLFKNLQESRKALSLYSQSLKTAQAFQIRQTLRRFPIERVVKRFVEIWLASDPMPIRFLRRTGRLLETPFRWIVRTAGAFRSASGPEHVAETDPDYPAQLESDLLHAAHALFVLVLSDPMVLSGASGNPVPSHPAILSARNALAHTGWPAIRDALLEKKETIAALSGRMDMELEKIARDFRNKMHLSDHLRQSFSAALNLIPATIAVTYILHTGDPVGAVGIKVKLASLIGVKDLYALLAIPATSGMKTADMKQLQEMLEPLTQAWFAHKQEETGALFEALITGPFHQRVREALNAAEPLEIRIREALRGI